MKLKKHSKYKQSGIDWIGEIPEGWNVRKIKNIGNLSTSSVDKKSDPSEKPIKLLNYMDIYSSKDKRITKNIDFMNVTIKPSQYITSNLIKGDLLFTPSSETADDIGHSAVIMEDLKGVVYSYHILRLRFNNNENIDDEFKRYVFNNHYFLNQLSSKATGTTRMTLGLYSFKDSSFVLPPIQTQKRISSFLDSKTLQIQNLIEKDKKLIELLKEKKVSLINKAVTKGLDDSVKMKDSKIDWIGKIPESWEVRKLKHLTEFLTCGLASTPEYVEEENGVPFLSAQNVRPNRMDLSKYNYISKELHKQLTRKRKPKRGDILVTRVGAGIGEACLVDIDFEFSVYVSLTHIRTNKELLNGFLVYFFLTDYSKFLNSFGTIEGGGQGNLNVQNVETYLLGIPPIQEQQDIVEFLDKETTKIDNHIKKVEKRIELYEEYKKSLIYNVVTGKIKV